MKLKPSKRPLHMFFYPKYECIKFLEHYLLLFFQNVTTMLIILSNIIIKSPLIKKCLTYSDLRLL